MRTSVNWERLGFLQNDGNREYSGIIRRLEQNRPVLKTYRRVRSLMDRNR